MANTSNAGYYSKYYPINFSVADRFVFYESLTHKTSNLVKFLVSKVRNNLYGAQKNPTTRDKDGNASKKMQTALEFLRQAYLFERDKEQKFFQAQMKKHPELVKILEEFQNNEDYISFIARLNSMLHGTELFKKELTTEIKRIKRYRKGNEFYKATRKRRAELQKFDYTKAHFLGPFTEEQIKDREELSLIFRTRENLFTEGGKEFSADDPYFTLDGKKVFRGIFSSQSYISTLTTAIIETYGARLFTYQSGKLKINTRQVNTLIKLLTDKAYELLLLNEGGFKRGKNQEIARGAARNENLRRARRVVESKDFQNFINGLLNSPEDKDLFSSLDKIADQYELPIDSLEGVKVTKAEITSFKNKIKKAYDKERASAIEQGEKFLTFSQWRQKTGTTDADLEQMIIQSKSVHVQAYYTNEGMNVADFLSNDITYALVSGSKNLTDDVQAGYLVVESSFDDSEFQKITQRTASKLEKAQQKAIKEMKKTTTADDLRKNTYELNKAREEQRKILEEANKEINEIHDGLQDILSHINIHTTVKGYKSIDAGRFVFEGAAFGSNIIEQATILEDLTMAGGINAFDRNWLIFALINCGTGMIGEGNKHHLEDYLSTFVGLLMFNDAYLIAEDIQKFMNGTYINTSVEDIHLYVLNNVYIPNSYVLEQTYLAMKFAFSNLEEYLLEDFPSHGTNLTLTTYDSGYKKKFTAEELDFDNGGPAWFTESKNALDQTKLTMTFMAGFLDVLQQINDAMPQ